MDNMEESKLFTTKNRYLMGIFMMVGVSFFGVEYHGLFVATHKLGYGALIIRTH